MTPEFKRRLLDELEEQIVNWGLAGPSEGYSLTRVAFENRMDAVRLVFHSPDETAGPYTVHVGVSAFLTALVNAL